MQRRTLLAAIGTGVVGGGWLLLDERSPTETVRQFLLAMADGDIREMKQYVHDELEGGLSAREGFEIAIEEVEKQSVPEVLDFTRPQVTEQAIEQRRNQLQQRTESVGATDYQYVYARFNLVKYGKTSTGYFLLVKDQEWLILDAF